MKGFLVWCTCLVVPRECEVSAVACTTKAKLPCMASACQAALWSAALISGRADAGALELLQKGELPADHWDWECGAGFRFVRDEDVQEESAAKASTQRCVPSVHPL